MKPCERDALIKYLEFRLIGLVDSIEDNSPESCLRQQLLLEACDILADFEDCFIIQEFLNSGSSTTKR